MKPLSYSLLALTAAIALWGQPTWGCYHAIKHTIISGVQTDSGYTFDLEPRGTVAELKEKLAGQYQAPKNMFHVRWRGNEKPDDFDLDQVRTSANELHLVFDSFLIKVVKSDGGYVILAGEKEETVASFKDRIAKRLNIPREMQRIIGTTREFQDGEKLAGSLIVDRTSYSVSLVSKPGQVRVKFPSGEIIAFEYEHFEMVASLKDKIQQAKSIARERQTLLLKGGGELEDDQVLVNLGLRRGSILTLVERDPGELDIIYVRLASQRLLTFEVSLTRDTVASLKGKISRAEGLTQLQQHLFLFKGKEMGNSRLLGDYVTKSESVVNLLLCSERSGQGVVPEPHLHFGKLGEEVDLMSLGWIFNIKPNDTVASVKQTIKLMNERSWQDYTMHLFFENKELEDDKSMFEHVNHDGSMMQLRRHMKDGPEMIHVRLPTGRLITFELDMMSKVKELKDLIDQEMGPNKTSRKRLFYGDQELNDEKTLSDYNIRSGQTVSLIVARPGDY